MSVAFQAVYFSSHCWTVWFLFCILHLVTFPAKTEGKVKQSKDTRKVRASKKEEGVKYVAQTEDRVELKAGPRLLSSKGSLDLSLVSLLINYGHTVVFVLVCRETIKWYPFLWEYTKLFKVNFVSQCCVVHIILYF